MQIGTLHGMLYRDTVATFLERVRTGKVCLGVHSSAMSPQLIELYGFAGLDFVIVGTEVEAMDNARMENLLRAANAARTVPIVKLRHPDPDLVTETMNYGAPMVMTPHVTSGPQLERLVAATRFEPHGTRGECPVGRYTGYGTMHLDESREAANTTSCIIPIIEDRAAMDHLDEIAAVDGVDIIEIGPFDLSRSLGVPGQGFASPIVLDAIDAIVAAARRHGKAVLTPLWISSQTDSPTKIISWQMDELIARGVTLLYGIEVVLLAEYFRTLMPLRGVRERGDEEAAALETAEAAARPPRKPARNGTPARSVAKPRGARPRPAPAAPARQRR
jgi:2-keto-3-deoxy-L-rhamnonate aldolase RhmA